MSNENEHTLDFVYDDAKVTIDGEVYVVVDVTDGDGPAGREWQMTVKPASEDVENGQRIRGEETVVERYVSPSTWVQVARYTNPAHTASALEDARQRARMGGVRHRVRQVTTVEVCEP